MTGAEQARAAIDGLGARQMRAALMALWVKDPTSFWAAVKAAAS